MCERLPRLGKTGTLSDTSDTNGGYLSDNVLKEIDAEIARLQQARVLLMDIGAPAKLGRPARPGATIPRKTKRRTMSAEAREKIRQAQLKRWAADKKSANKSAK